MSPELLNLTTAIVAVLGLIGVIIGWFVASKISIRQAKEQVLLQTDYKIYESMLKQVNDIIHKIADFTTGINTHTGKMANILNETHSDVSVTNARRGELNNLWSDETNSILVSGNAIDESIIEFMRALDMSGTNFHGDTKVYSALIIVQKDASKAVNQYLDDYRTFESKVVKRLQDLSAKTTPLASVDIKVNDANK